MSGVVRTNVLATLPHGFLERDADPATVSRGRLVRVRQVHSATCVVAGDWDGDARPPADAVVTDQPGLMLAIVTADCAPVLLADHTAWVIGAAHAGWKGALSGVTDATVDAMLALGARRDRVVAAVGPCIARASYEVDAAFAERFREADGANERFFAAGKRDGHLQFDLEGYVVARLAKAGVERIEALGIDTYANADRFCSYRRATQRGESDYGRQLSVIALTTP